MVETKFRKYLFSYNHDGANWNLEMLAESPEDARQRVAKLVFATYQGEIVAKLPASFGLLARCAVAVENAFRRLRRLLTA